MCILDTTGLFFTSLKASIHFSVNVLVGKIDRQLVKKSYKSFKNPMQKTNKRAVMLCESSLSNIDILSLFLYLIKLQIRSVVSDKGSALPYCNCSLHLSLCRP